MNDQQRSKQKLVLELLLVFDFTRFDCQSQLQTLTLCTKKDDLKSAIRVTATAFWCKRTLSCRLSQLLLLDIYQLILFTLVTLEFCALELCFSDDQMYQGGQRLAVWRFRYSLGVAPEGKVISRRKKRLKNLRD